MDVIYKFDNSNEQQLKNFSKLLHYFIGMGITFQYECHIQQQSARSENLDNIDNIDNIVTHHITVWGIHSNMHYEIVVLLPMLKYDEF